MPFEKYLEEKGIKEKDLKAGIQKLENLLGRAIAYTVPNTDPNITNGLIWQNGGINPDTSPEDIERSIGILRNAVLKKRAQGLVDQFDAEEYQTQQPLAMKLNPTADDTDVETIHPLDSQQIGKMHGVVPDVASMVEDPDDPKPPETAVPMVGMSMDDRVYELLKISV